MENSALAERIATIRDTARLYPATLYEGRVRAMIVSNRDGFADQCVIRRGGRIFIDLAAVERWLADGRQDTSNALPR